MLGVVLKYVWLNSTQRAHVVYTTLPQRRCNTFIQCRPNVHATSFYKPHVLFLFIFVLDRHTIRLAGELQTDQDNDYKKGIRIILEDLGFYNTVIEIDKTYE